MQLRKAQTVSNSSTRALPPVQSRQLRFTVTIFPVFGTSYAFRRWPPDFLDETS